MKKSTFLSKGLVVVFFLFCVKLFAQLPVPFTPRLPGGSIKVKGDIILIGNGIVTGKDLPLPYNGTDINNNNEGVYINEASGGDSSIFSSSSADLAINNDCKQILYAGLYWASVYPLEVANNSSVQFQGTPRLEDWNQVKFKLPTGGFIDLVADTDADAPGEEDDIIFDGYEYYGSGVENSFKDSPIICYKNVTSLLQGLTDADGEYTLANLRATRGRRLGGCSAGWTLVVVYESPILPSKFITLFDGYAGVQNTTELDIPVSGFQTLPAPLPVNSNIGVAALEGDIGITGDSFQFKASTSPLYTVLSDAINEEYNFFNSSITFNGVHVTNRNPASLNTLGLDINNFILPNPLNSVLPNDATAGDLKLTTNGDGYGVFLTSFAVEVIEPKITLTKIVEDTDGNDIGNQIVDLGDELNYVIGFQNTGNDDATNLIIRDVLPINVVFNYPDDIEFLPPGVTVQSYNPVTRELIFSVDNSVVEENDPVQEIRFKVTVVASCSLLNDACSNVISNQAFVTYNGTINSTFAISDDPSYSSNTGCLITPAATNFLADLNCAFEEEVILCGDSVTLTAGNGYDAYSWSTSPSGTPVIGTTQSITVTTTGTYYVHNTATAPCQSIDQVFDVITFGEGVTNPLIPVADEVVICPNDGKELPNIYLCGANDSRFIQTGITDTTSIIWEQLDETSCTAVTNQDCANEDPGCLWNQVGTGPDFLIDTAGQYRLTLNYEGGCFNQFYFNVYSNLLIPTATSRDIICGTPGEINVGGVPSGYEFSIDGINYQTNNVFPITTPGMYSVYVRQIAVTPNPCIFSVPDVQIRERNFTVSSNVIQPLCFGDKGSVILAANDARPQYYFSISQGGTIIDSVGPILESDHTFSNLNPGSYIATISTDDGCLETIAFDIINPPLLEVTAAITQPLTCTDGEITIYPEGGTPPYYYYINSSTVFQTSPIITVTASGTYNITLVDANNCIANTSIDIDSVPQPDFTISSTNMLCYDSGDTGTITVNVTNPNGNSLLYSIDNGATFSNSPVFTGLAAGDYDVVVQYTYGADVCLTAPQTITVTIPPAIDGTATLTAPYTCVSFGTINVSGVTGGTPPYTYSIDGTNFQTGTTFTGLIHGNYTVTILDSSGCTFITNSLSIDPVNPPSDLIFSNTPLLCADGTSDVTIAGIIGGIGTLEFQIISPVAFATAYQPSNVFIGLIPGTYTFQVRDEYGCEYSESYTITPIPDITVNTVLTKDLDCTGTPNGLITGTIANGTAPYTYSVSFNSGTYSGSFVVTGSSFTYSAATDGAYQFQITDANGCIAESGVQMVNAISLPEISSVSSTPNICFGDTNGTIQVTINNTVGTPPFTISVRNDTTGSNFGSQTSGLPSGDYTITLTDANSCTDTETVSIGGPNEIVVNYHAVDIICNASGVSSGSVIIDTVTGGTAPYTYYVSSSNGYSDSEINPTGTTSTTFDTVNFGLYQINVVDANGCSVLIEDVLVASPPDDLDISITATSDCVTGGEVLVELTTLTASVGPFYFAIYQGPSTVYPNPVGSWIPEDAPGSKTATFTGLIPGVTYTFIVYDTDTNCSYYETAMAPVPTNSLLTATALTSNNITCVGSADGNVSFTVNSIYAVPTDVTYEIFDSLSLVSTTISGSDTVPTGGSITINNLGPLPFGTYFVLISETSGPNAGCGVVTVPFNINESALDLNISASVITNANCNANSGVINAIATDGTAPYEYQITTTATAPLATDPLWASSNNFNVNAGTYFVHVKDAYGCIKTTSAVVLPSDPEPVISALMTSDCTVTEGNFQIDVTLDTPGIAPHSYSIDGGAFQTRVAPFTISNLASGTHTVEVRDANGCGNLVSIDIFPPVDIIPTVTAAPTCNNDDGEITISASGGSGSYAYTISPLGTISLSGNVFSNVPSGTYTITVTDTVTLCSEDVTIVLPSAPPFSVVSTPISDVTCFGDTSGSFEFLVNEYSGPYSYEVFNGSGISVTTGTGDSSTTNPQLISGLLAGNYSVVVTQTSSPFCTATSNVILVDSPAALLTLIATETSNVTCDDDKGTITAIANGGWGTYEYELTGAATVAYSPNGTFTNLSAGSYTVNVRDAGGCFASENVTLVIPPPISATVTASATSLLCFGDTNASITVSSESGGQGSNYSYTLNRTVPTVSTSGPQSNPVFSGLEAGTYNVVVTDGYNCSFNSPDIIITEPALVEATLVKAVSQTCVTGTTLTLSATGGTAPYTYSNNGFTTTLGSFTTSIDINLPQGTSGTYRYDVRDANGCVAYVSNDITIDAFIPVTVSLDVTNATINCAGDTTGVIIATAQGGIGTYVYTLQDASGTDIPGAIQNSPGVFSELPIGTYQVYVTSGDCEETSALVTIAEPSTPLTASFNVTNVVCNGSNNGIIEVFATGGTGNIKYAISPQLNQFFEESIFNNLATGTYQVIAQDELGCYVLLDVTVTEPAPVVLNIVPNSILPELCEGDINGEFSVEILGGNLPYSVVLDDINGTYTTGAPTQTQFDFVDLEGGDHTVYVRDSQGCESEWNITFPESVLINAEIDIAYCTNTIDANSNMVTVYVDDTTVSLSDIDYALDGGVFQTSNVFTDVTAGNHVINVRHTNACEIVVNFEVEQFDPLQVVLTNENLNQLEAVATGGSGNYEYEFTNESTSYTEQNGDTNTYNIYESANYTVIVTDSNGCVATATGYFEFIDICVTNYFTPNDDGNLDEWGPGCTNQYKNLTFDIFDRYGRKVVTLNVGDKWDGTYNGKELPTGDYWYVVKLNDEKDNRHFVGHFTLYR